jgi:CelD/BcsL family acetyltransferase involved in cellulose biosynthesis
LGRIGAVPAPASGPLVVEQSRLGEHAADWDGFVAAQPVPSPFLRSWWLEALAEDGACFVLVLREGRLLGGLALNERRLPGLRIYRFLGTGTLAPDHLDVVADPAHRAEVVAALRAWATGRGNRLFDLDGVAATSELPRWLPAARTSEREPAPYQPLPGDPDEYFASRPKSFRKTVRRTQNRIRAMDAHIRAADAHTLRSDLDAFAAMHRARGDREALLAELPLLRRLLAAGLPSGEARVDVLESGGQPLGIHIWFAVCGRANLYQTARTVDARSDNASTMLGLDAVNQMIAAGGSEVDLLRGDEEYKRYFADHRRALLRVQAASGPLARTALLATELARRVLRAIRAQRASAAGSGS